MSKSSLSLALTLTQSWQASRSFPSHHPLPVMCFSRMPRSKSAAVPAVSAASLSSARKHAGNARVQFILPTPTSVPHRLWLAHVSVSLSSTKCTCCLSWALTHSLPARTTTTNDCVCNILYYPLRVRRRKGGGGGYIATLPPTTTSKGRGEKTISNPLQFPFL